MKRKQMKDADLVNAILAAAIMSGENEQKTEPATDKSVREKSRELGVTMYESFLGFMDAGFTPEQAFQIVLTIKKG